MARPDPFVDHLHQVGLFAACSRKDLQKVAERSEDRRVTAGTTIVNEGDDGDELFVIIDGTARVSRQSRKFATLGPGIGFGELALLLENARPNATIVAESDMELVVVGQREFAALLDEVPSFARKIFAGTAHRLREAETPAPSSSARKLGSRTVRRAWSNASSDGFIVPRPRCRVEDPWRVRRP